MSAHEDFDSSFSFFVCYKEWPKDAFYGEGTRMSAHEDFDSSFSFFVWFLTTKPVGSPQIPPLNPPAKILGPCIRNVMCI